MPLHISFLKYISPQIVTVVLNPTIKVSLYSGLLHHPFLSFSRYELTSWGIDGPFWRKLVVGCPVTDVIESVEVDQICVNQVLILTSHLGLF